MWALIVTSLLIFAAVVCIQLHTWVPVVFIVVVFCAAGLRSMGPHDD